ncbi:MAG TPA: xanthine dehydrogenase accessory protein XdhC [Acetobacteraceae bacterium]|nr:xanthine dehydrogenase accessory protein XdhC [Acetobacteraceae bacterium]
MTAWVQALARCADAGMPAVLVTVLSVRGSAPREAGCKMVVTGEELHGSIGGGTLEHRCAAIARDLLAAPPPGPVLRDFPLGPALGQCCGGQVSVLFETVEPASWRIVLFGAGHVGRALVRLLADLPCRVDWIDPRPDIFPAGPSANITPRQATDPAALVPDLPAGCTVLVMTHDHQLDYAIISAALRRPDLGWIGLIGSATKRARFSGRLARGGLDPDAIARLVCPIGLPGTGGKLPAEIAIAVAAQLLQIRGSVRQGRESRKAADLTGRTGMAGNAACAASAHCRGCTE